MPASPIPIPAPFLGMNTREGAAALQPAEARYLENWQPEGSAVKIRPGQVVSSSGGQSQNAVETLAAYNGASGQQRIGVNGGSIYDFTSATAILLSAAGYTDSRFQTECYSNYLIGVNGTDTPWAYNGTSVAATGFVGSGLTLTNLVNVAKVRNRLWFCEKNSADVWYGGVGAITGTLTKFQLSQFVSGGYPVAIGAHSQDAGAGPDDYTAFIMNTGEVALYAGDPSTTFSKVGNYSMPRPVGRQCLVNIGGPLAVLTHIGLVPLQASVTGVAFDTLAIGNYGKIGPSIKRDLDLYAANEGWQAIEHEGKVIINVPVVEGATSRQWVYNYLAGGAWSAWSGVNAACFCSQADTLYIGLWTDGVVRALEGTTDLGEAITLKAKGAYAAPAGASGITVTGLRFDITIEGTLTGKFGLDTDFIERPLTSLATITLASSTASTPWGSDWGSDWSTSTQYANQWLGAYGQGRAVGVVMEAEAAVTDISWFGAQILAQPSGVLP